jgi:hypothetical protein
MGKGEMGKGEDGIVISFLTGAWIFAWATAGFCGARQIYMETDADLVAQKMAAKQAAAEAYTLATSTPKDNAWY